MDRDECTFTLVVSTAPHLLVFAGSILGLLPTFPVRMLHTHTSVHTCSAESWARVRTVGCSPPVALRTIQCARIS